MFESYFQDCFVLALAAQSYAKLGAAQYLPHFAINARQETLDDSLYSNLVSEGIFHRDTTVKTAAISEIFAEEKLLQFISQHSQNKKVFILVSKSSPELEAVCDQYGWQIAAPASQLSVFFENKNLFRSTASHLGIAVPRAYKTNLSEIQNLGYDYFSQQLTSKFVFQANSKSKKYNTVMIDSPSAYQSYQKSLSPEDLETPEILASEYLTGQPLSMVACVTQHGVVTGYLQFQIIDSPLAMNPNWRTGFFCGHDWALVSENEPAQMLATQIMQKYGEYMAKQGYRGLFGIDFIYNSQQQNLTALECNPRYTGSFPTYTFFEQSHSSVTLELIHLLESLKLAYPESMVTEYQTANKVLTGSHLNLSQKNETVQQISRTLLPGLYRYTLDGKCTYVKPSCNFQDLTPQTFLLLNGVQPAGTQVKPNSHLGKLIFSKSIIDKNTLQIDQTTAQVVEEIYNQWFN